jgi:hypothetical protein
MKTKLLRPTSSLVSGTMFLEQLIAYRPEAETMLDMRNRNQ